MDNWLNEVTSDDSRTPELLLWKCRYGFQISENTLPPGHQQLLGLFSSSNYCLFSASPSPPAEKLLEELLSLRPPEFPHGVNNPSHSEEVEERHPLRKGLGTQCLPHRELTVQHMLLPCLTPPAAASLFLPAPFQTHFSNAGSRTTALVHKACRK